MLFANIYIYIYINETGKNKTNGSNAQNLKKKIKTSKQFNSKYNEIVPF